jgi:hypothetical protein
LSTKLHIAGRLLAIAFVVVNSGQIGNTAPPHQIALSQQASPERSIPVDYLEVPDLPLSISIPMLVKTEKGYLIRCSAANNSVEPMLGITFLILVLDSENKMRSSGSWSAGIQVPGYVTRDLSIRVPLKLAIKNSYRIVLAPEQLIGRESIWQVMKARELAEAYARGDQYVVPKVRRVANQFDPPSAALRMIY